MDFKHVLSIWGAALLLFAFVACTSDEPNGEMLPENEYPLVMDATGLQTMLTPKSVSTRATVDGNWQGVKTVAVETGGLTKEYTVTAGNRVAKLSSNDPHYWTSHNDMIVNAWWPCYDVAGNFLETMPPVVVKSDQSTLADFQGSDFIAAEANTVRFDYPTIAFEHRTARVAVNLKAGVGVESVAGAEVSLVNLSIADNNPDTICTYTTGNDTYEALIAPQTVVASTPFVQVKLNGSAFVFTLKKDAVLEANHRYIYNVSVTTAGKAFSPIGQTAEEGAVTLCSDYGKEEN